MKSLKEILIFITIFFLFTVPVSAGWLIFHKPAFKGKVINAETKKPIEGAVVVAVYTTHTIIGGPAGGDSSIIKVKETLTDKSGEFNFPSYTTLMQPNATDFYTSFIIYRSGYGNYPNNRISPPGGISRATKENFFLAENFGKQGEVTIAIGDDRGSKPGVTYGLVELPRLKTREERLRAVPGKPMDFGSKKLPYFYKAINEEYRKFGVSEVK